MFTWLYSLFESFKNKQQMKINFSLEGSCSGTRLRPLDLFERILRSQVYNFVHDSSMDKQRTQ